MKYILVEHSNKRWVIEESTKDSIETQIKQGNNHVSIVMTNGSILVLPTRDIKVIKKA